MRRFPSKSLSSLMVWAALGGGLARAQPAPVAAPAAPGVTTPTPPPVQALGPEGATPIAIPAPPTVNDPMLEPMPPAARNIESWEEALRLVRARSTDLRTAYDDVLRAEAQQRVALAGALTSVNANGTFTQNLLFRETPASNSLPITDASGNTTNVTVPNLNVAATKVPIENYGTASVSAVQPLLALRAWHNIGTAREATRASTLSLEDLKRTVALGVANALVGVVTAERIAELNRIGFRSALERLELTTRKRTLGAANGLDVVRAQQDVESARGTLVTGDESLRQSREALGLAVGFPMEVGVAPTIRIDGLEQDAQRACKASDTIDDRADLQAARARALVAKRNIDDVWLEFAPTINASSALGTSTVTSSISPRTTWNIQAVLSIPIWDGGARYGFLRDARAQEDQAQQALENLRRQATIQVVQARRNVKVAEDSRKVAADTRALAAEVDRLTQTAYREGQGTSLELVVAASALRQAEVNLALQEFGVVRARVLAILALATCPW